MELTHRCPLHCPYCSNPLELDKRSQEMDTATVLRVLDEAAALGILHVHLSGGEPTARQDIVEITAKCASAGLYSNLITSGVGRALAVLPALADAGLDHVPALAAGRGRRLGRPRRRPQGVPRDEDALRRRDRASRPRLDGQCRDPSRQHRPGRRLHRAGAEARRSPPRDRAYPVLRVGLQEPGIADAGAARRRSLVAHRRCRAQAPHWLARHRPRCAGLLRAASEGLCRRLGAAS